MSSPQDSGPVLTEEAGKSALREHVVAKAFTARERHGPEFDLAALERLFLDPECVRFPTTIRFDAGPLRAGEFAWPQPVGESPKEGFVLNVHTAFEGRAEALSLICAYHVVAVNYLDVATNVEAELFGATLLGIEVDDYYTRLCGLADELPAGDPSAAQ